MCTSYYHRCAVQEHSGHRAVKPETSAWVPVLGGRKFLRNCTDVHGFWQQSASLSPQPHQKVVWQTVFDTIWLSPVDRREMVPWWQFIWGSKMMTEFSYFPLFPRYIIYHRCVFSVYILSAILVCLGFLFLCWPPAPHLLLPPFPPPCVCMFICVWKSEDNLRCHSSVTPHTLCQYPIHFLWLT